MQDKNSIAWKKLCAYVEKVEAENRDEFSPLEELGPELFSQIHTLPETISNLKKVTRVWLYGSKLKRIPPEIGEMESLEYFDPYTSYDLHWFPYEITNCKKLKYSRVSTRELYGNYKNRMGFPRLTHNPVKYTGNTLKCSICKKEMNHSETNQLWISLQVATDILPLLANLCSKECESKLPTPPEDYLQFAHKGGAELKQPLDANEMFELRMIEIEQENVDETETDIQPTIVNNTENRDFKLSKLIKKIWIR